VVVDSDVVVSVLDSVDAVVDGGGGLDGGVEPPPPPQP
jgi:hypothetical protein